MWLFGSLAVGSHFRGSSDIDLAVEGLEPDRIFLAVGRALGISEFDIDIKPFERMPKEWQERIRAEGEVLA
ncbi:MAG: nucleotidyltransferase domain-containing protein [Planctomycetes bacterium]|nr:nucleotidyltransferase domain-containing protein [Planctomycetota bacterium]